MVQKEQNERARSSGLTRRAFNTGLVTFGASTLLNGCKTTGTSGILNLFSGTEEKEPIVIEDVSDINYFFPLINNSLSVPFRKLVGEMGNNYEPTVVGSPIKFSGGVYFGKADGRLRSAISAAGGDFTHDDKLTQSEWFYTAMRILGAGFIYDNYDRRNMRTVPQIFYKNMAVNTGVSFKDDSQNVGVSNTIRDFVATYWRDDNYASGRRAVAYDLNMLLGLAIAGGADAAGSPASADGASGASGSGSGASSGQSGRGGGSGAGAK